jgi:hypothetical protein
MKIVGLTLAAALSLMTMATSCGGNSSSDAALLANTSGVSVQATDGAVVHIKAYGPGGAGAECAVIRDDAKPEDHAMLEPPMDFTPTCTYNDGAIMVSVYSSNGADAQSWCTIVGGSTRPTP